MKCTRRSTRGASWRSGYAADCKAGCISSENKNLASKSYQDKSGTQCEPDNPSSANQSFFSIDAAQRFFVSFERVGTHAPEFPDRDRREVERAAEGLSLLTLDEIEILSAFGCFQTADNRVTRSWRGRLLRACASLRRIEPSLISVAVELAQVRRRKIDAVFADGEDRSLVSPFTAAPRGSEDE